MTNYAYSVVAAPTCKRDGWRAPLATAGEANRVFPTGTMGRQRRPAGLEETVSGVLALSHHAFKPTARTAHSCWVKVKTEQWKAANRYRAKLFERSTRR
jgi:hypothetical protein